MSVMAAYEDGAMTQELLDALEWLAVTNRDILLTVANEAKHVEMPTENTAPMVAKNCTQLAESIGFKWYDDKDEYVEKIKTSQERILDGHTYEVCLTNALTRKDVDEYNKNRQLHRDLYYAMRKRNPAPYAAFFDFSNASRAAKRSIFRICTCAALRPNGS